MGGLVGTAAHLLLALPRRVYLAVTRNDAAEAEVGVGGASLWWDRV